MSEGPKKYPSAPSITVKGAVRRGLYAKAASRRGMRLNDWALEALEEKWQREEEERVKGEK